MRFRVIAATVLALQCTALARADGPDPSLRARYDAHVERGLAAFDAGRKEEARAELERAHALIPSARTLRGLGMIAMALDRFTVAKRELEASLVHQRSPLSAAMRKEVEELLAWMRASLAIVRIEATPPGGQVAIDGVPVDERELLLEPGEHTVTVSADGHASHQRTFQLSLDEPLLLRVALAPEEPPPPSAAAPVVVAAPPEVRAAAGGPVWPWFAGSAGVLAVGGAGVLLALGLDDHASVEEAAVGVRLAEIEPAHDRAPWLIGAGIGLGVAGVACLGIAAIALVQSERERTELTSFPGGLQLRSRF
jgi:hypothetical protein